MSALREDLRQKDEELLAYVEHLIALEGALKRKDEELQLSKGVEALCGDLQIQVDQLQDQLNERQFEVEGLRGEVARRQQLIEEVESSRRHALKRTYLFKLANWTLHADRDNVWLTAEVKKSSAQGEDLRVGEREC